MTHNKPLTLLEALAKAREVDARPLPESSGERPFRVLLQCGFEPLHVLTFLKAHLAERVVGRRIEIATGTYGNLVGNLANAFHSEDGALAIVLEWSDLDARLGHRALGGWLAEDLDDALEQSKSALGHVLEMVREASGRLEIVVCLPSLPLPVVFGRSSAAFTARSAEIQQILFTFMRDLVVEKSVTVLSMDTEDDIHDLKSEIVTGFPYTLPFTDKLTCEVARALCPPALKKGLITDLDGTLWKGVVGDDGPEAVQWDLESGALIHGLYQQTLAALSASGVLIAIASKNSTEVAMQALCRDDMIFPESEAFPKEIHWEPKSISVQRILRAWNISADDVVFIDDSEAELAEVKEALPSITGLRFSNDDIAEVGHLLENLGILFGNREATAEDRIRAQSLRYSSEFKDATETVNHTEAFLVGLNQTLSIDLSDASDDERAFELLNKTNQFNLNGRRYSRQDWRFHHREPNSFSVTAIYQDKFGPLGKIAVLGGRIDDKTLCINYWAMSCRAFGRRIEHICLETLFECFDVDSIILDFQITDRNGPFVSFAESVANTVGLSQCKIERYEFLSQCPILYHKLTIVGQEEVLDQHAG